MRFHRFAVLLALVLGCVPVTDARGASPRDDPQATLTRFIAAHNAGDLRGVMNLLSNSADFLWITQGNVVRGHEAAIRHFREAFRQRSRIDVDWPTVDSVGLDISTTEIFVSGTITAASAAKRVHISVILIDTVRGWRVQTFVVDDLPIGGPKEKARPDGEGRAMGGLV